MALPFFLVIGTSSSGKTTAIREAVEVLTRRGVCCHDVDPDEVFYQIGRDNPGWTNKEIKKHYPEKFLKELRSTAHDGCIIFVAFIDHSFDEAFERLAADTGRPFRVVLWYTDLNKTIDNSMSRECGRPIGGILSSFVELFKVSTAQTPETLGVLSPQSLKGNWSKADKREIDKFARATGLDKKKDVYVEPLDEELYDEVFTNADADLLVEYVSECLSLTAGDEATK